MLQLVTADSREFFGGELVTQKAFICMGMMEQT